MKIVCALFATLILSGCENHRSRGYQRFLPIGNIGEKSGQNSAATVPSAAALALDTKTGTGISHEDFNPWDDRELEGDSHRGNFAFAFFGEGSHNLAVI
jgi:hypothetical protein